MKEIKDFNYKPFVQPDSRKALVSKYYENGYEVFTSGYILIMNKSDYPEYREKKMFGITDVAKTKSGRPTLRVTKNTTDFIVKECSYVEGNYVNYKFLVNFDIDKTGQSVKIPLKDLKEHEATAVKPCNEYKSTVYYITLFEDKYLSSYMAYNIYRWAKNIGFKDSDSITIYNNPKQNFVHCIVKDDDGTVLHYIVLMCVSRACEDNMIKDYRIR